MPVGASVLVGLDTQTAERVELPYEDRDVGLAIIGKSRTGKSSLLEHLILADLVVGTPGVLIDPHGLLAERVTSLAPPAAARRIVLVDPSVAAFGLNLLACQDPHDDRYVTAAADAVIETIKKLYGQEEGFAPRLQQYLDLAVRTLVPGGFTLVEVPRLFRDDVFRRQCLSLVINPQAQTDLQARWSEYARLRPADQFARVDSLLTRLDDLLVEVVRNIVGSRKTTLPFDDVLNGTTFLICRLPTTDRLRHRRRDLIGLLLLCELANRIFTQTATVAKSPTRAHIYIDEYQRFATPTTAQFLTEGRKFGVGLTIAHQGREQISDTAVSDAEMHAGTLIITQVTGTDAEFLAAEVPAKPREEWQELVTVEDGVEDTKVPARNAAERMAITQPSSRLATEARRMLIGDGEYLVTLSPYERGRLDVLLAAVMDNGPPTREWLLERLVESGLLFKGGSTVSAANLLPLPQFPERDPRNPWHDVSWLTGDRFGRKIREFGDIFARNEILLDRWRKAVDELFAVGFRPWFAAHLTYKEQLLAGEYPLSFFFADIALEQFAKKYQWRDLFDWVGNEPTPGPTSRRNRPVPPDRTREYIGRVRERLRWVIALCDSVAERPIVVPSGEQRPRYRQQLVVHPRQSVQDARNELAGRLVHPAEPFIAHVRLPRGYHEVRLVGPIGRDTDSQQLAMVWQRSQEVLKPTEPALLSELPGSRAPISRRPPGRR